MRQDVIRLSLAFIEIHCSTMSKLHWKRACRACNLFYNAFNNRTNKCNTSFFDYNTLSLQSSLIVTRQIHYNNLSISDELDNIFSEKDTSISNWIIERRVQKFCNTYALLSKKDKHDCLWDLALRYTVDHRKICLLAQKLVCIEPDKQSQLIVRERSLKNALTPHYQWLFILMGRLEHGVKFLVDLRTDVLELLSETVDAEKTVVMQQLNITLHDLLLLWFSVGFLHLERITWQSSCDMLQKISDYEAIHPIRNWVDLKRRVGPYRRCFVFTHPSMPREPLVVLHTALCDLIPESVKGIEEAETRIISKNTDSGKKENKSEIKAAIFYSIASTQKGLKGIDLGNYMIKKVAKEVIREFPTIDQLSSLSPIPNFRLWFLDKLKQESMRILTKQEEQSLEKILESRDLKSALKKVLNNSLWTNDKDLANVLKDPLTRLCAWYLYMEKRRSYALNNVANFHLQNGAIMWRINWMADPSPRGAENSCGIMVNYRYILDETEENSRNYIENKKIKASESVLKLVSQAKALQE